MEIDLRFVNDLELLRETAIEVGLGNTQARQLLWPLLCRVDPTNPFQVARVSAHLLTDQVEKDVKRSMFLVQRDERERARKRLRTLVNDVLDAHLELSYYQVGEQRFLFIIF
jgi:hypothetical protein